MFIEWRVSPEWFQVHFSFCAPDCKQSLEVGGPFQLPQKGSTYPTCWAGLEVQFGLFRDVPLDLPTKLPSSFACFDLDQQSVG